MEVLYEQSCEIVEMDHFFTVLLFKFFSEYGCFLYSQMGHFFLFFLIVCAEIFSLIIQIMKARLILRFELWRWQKNSEQKELINRYHWLLQGKETNITCTYFCGFVIPLILVISLVVIYIIFCFLAPPQKKKGRGS